MKQIKLAIVGGAGRMGQQIIEETIKSIHPIRLKVLLLINYHFKSIEFLTILYSLQAYHLPKTTQFYK